MVGGPYGGTIMTDTPTTATSIIGTAEAEICKPWLRHVLSQQDWTATAQAASVESWVLLAHWADTARVHALFLDPQAITVVAVSTQVESGLYPALSPILPAAILYERMIHDLFGHEAGGAIDLRPWLDHGAWPDARPMAVHPAAGGAEPAVWEAGEQDQDMILALGPIWGRIEEAAHLRLVLAGPVVRHAESRLGFTHKGTLALMRSKSPRTAARFAARLSADATVAHAIAFAAAAEAALDVLAPPRAARLRVIMLELERIAGHLDSLAETSRLAGARPVWTACGFLREVLLRASQLAFGHRLMMDCVVPGGVAVDIAEGGAAALLHALGEISAGLPVIRRQHDGTTLASRLSGIGCTSAMAATSLGAGGIAGRACGRAFDARMAFMPEYRTLAPVMTLREAGDAAARQRVRLAEIEASLRLISSALGALPAGPLTVALPQISGEGIGCAESIRGDVWHWLQIDHGQIAAAFPRDPGWALWPLACHALENAMADDVEIIRASFALPASGMDL
jgi:Ni,Fe-hydrogenase III large subunit/Ni,Fe-hydrogenase III component G